MLKSSASYSSKKCLQALDLAEHESRYCEVIADQIEKLRAWS